MSLLKLEFKKNVIMVLVHGYLLCSVLFYVLFPFLLRFPPIAVVGGHVNYYAFLSAFAISETNLEFLRHCSAYIMVAIEISYPILLLIFYLKAVIKKRYKPFGVLAIISIAVVIATLIIAEICADELFPPPAIMWYDIIGNTIYSCVYFYLIKKGHPSKPAIDENC